MIPELIVSCESLMSRSNAWWCRLLTDMIRLPFPHGDFRALLNNFDFLQSIDFKHSGALRQQMLPLPITVVIKVVSPALFLSLPSASSRKLTILQYVRFR